MSAITGVRPGIIQGIARLDNVSLSMTNSYGSPGVADPTATLIAEVTRREGLRASATTFKAPATKGFKALVDIKV